MHPDDPHPTGTAHRQPRRIFFHNAPSCARVTRPWPGVLPVACHVEVGTDDATRPCRRLE